VTVETCLLNIGATARWWHRLISKKQQSPADIRFARQARNELMLYFAELQAALEAAEDP